MNLTAIINTPVVRLNATLDPVIINQAKLNLYELAQQRGFTGTFEDFLQSFATKPSDMVSSDPNNTLMVGSDNKLLCKLPQDDNIPDFVAIYNTAKGA